MVDGGEREDPQLDSVNVLVQGVKSDCHHVLYLGRSIFQALVNVVQGV